MRKRQFPELSSIRAAIAGKFSPQFPSKHSRFRAAVIDGILIGWALAATLIVGAIIVPLMISIALNAIGVGR